MTDILRLNVDRILLLFIDLQHNLLRTIPAGPAVIQRSLLLLEAVKRLNIPYIATSQYQKGLGGLDPQFVEAAASDALDKITFSCSADERIGEAIRKASKSWIVVSGIETHICVLQTTLDLLDQGYRVAVIADAVAARRPLDHDAGLKRMEGAGALLVTTEMLLYELLQRSDSPEFKQLLPLIKEAARTE